MNEISMENDRKGVLLFRFCCAGTVFFGVIRIRCTGTRDPFQGRLFPFTAQQGRSHRLFFSFPVLIYLLFARFLYNYDHV